MAKPLRLATVSERKSLTSKVLEAVIRNKYKNIPAKKLA